MKRYWVITESYESDGSYDPPIAPEEGPDVVWVEAESKRDALMLGVAEMLKHRRYRWCRDNRASGRPPWAGVRVEEDDSPLVNAQARREGSGE